MTNLNKVLLIGRLGRDPEIRYTKEGTAVANFSIATSEYWKDKSGAKQEKTEWHNIVAWDKKAKFAQEYLKKGSLIYIEGSLQTREWTDNNQVKRYTTEIVAKDIRFMEKRGDGQAPVPPVEEPDLDGPPEYADPDIPF